MGMCFKTHQGKAHTYFNFTGTVYINIGVVVSRICFINCMNSHVNGHSVCTISFLFKT
jgi:hypothetical protein